MTMKKNFLKKEAILLYIKFLIEYAVVLFFSNKIIK